jgi:hypothetical protein
MLHLAIFLSIPNLEPCFSEIILSCLRGITGFLFSGIFARVCGVCGHILEVKKRKDGDEDRVRIRNGGIGMPIVCKEQRYTISLANC